MKSLQQVNSRIDLLSQQLTEVEEMEAKIKRAMFAELQQLRTAKLCLENYSNEHQVLKMKRQVEARIKEVESEFSATHNISHLATKTQSQIRTKFYNKRGMKKFRSQLKFINYLLADFSENLFVNS